MNLPAGGVEARPNGKTDGTGTDCPITPAANLAHQRPQARPQRAVERLQALFYQLTVFAIQRGQVGHGAQGDQIQIAVGVNSVFGPLKTAIERRCALHCFLSWRTRSSGAMAHQARTTDAAA